MFIRRKTTPTLGFIDTLKSAENTCTFPKATPTAASKRKNIVTVGTRHGAPCIELIGKALNQHADKTFTIILEKPSIHDIGLTFFSQNLLMNSGLDETQNDVARKHSETLHDKGVELVGADGRKIFVGDNDRYITASLINKTIHKDFHLQNARIEAYARSGELINIALTILDGCLGLQSEFNLDSVLDSMNGLITYSDGTDLRKILTSLFERVNSLSIQLARTDKIAIRNHLYDDIQRIIDENIAQLNNQYNSEFDQYAAFLESRKKEIQIQMESLQSLVSEELSMESLLEGCGYDELDLTLLGGKDELLNSFLLQLKENSYTTMLDAIYLRAFCDLRLYTEIVCSARKNIIIIFGGNHTELLDEFIKRNNIENTHTNDSVVSHDDTMANKRIRNN